MVRKVELDSTFPIILDRVPQIASEAGDKCSISLRRGRRPIGDRVPDRSETVADHNLWIYITMALLRPYNGNSI